LLIEQEDDVAGFIGVDMTQTEEGLIEMKQVINHILDALGLDSKLATYKYTPRQSH
jgi:hypothetical protein